MSDNIQTNTIGRLTPCLQKKIDKTIYLVEVHFSDTSIQSVKDKLKRVTLHDLEHGSFCPWQNMNKGRMKLDKGEYPWKLDEGVNKKW